MILAVSTHSNIQIAVKSSKYYLNSLNAKVPVKKILHMIDATLKDAGVSKDIRSLYINSGPGMFTSLGWCLY